MTGPTTSSSSILHRDLRVTPTIINHVNGNYLYTETSQEIFDSVGGAAVISVGHNNSEINQALISQLNKVCYIHSGDEFTTEISEVLANYLISNNKEIDRVYFANSGSEANEAAIKLAVQYWYELGKPTKNQFISRNQSYHGNCLGGMSLSGHVARRKPYEEIIDSKRFHKVSPCYESRYKKEGETSEEYTQRLLDELEEKITEVGPENIAAFFAETIVGATTGCVPPTPGYFKGVREICDKYDILLILDEVMCGSGRTGTFFAWEQEDIVPDITTIGKALSSGYSPLSCVMVSKKLIDGLSNGSSMFNCGHTYQSFALSCAAGYAVQQIIKRDNLLDNVKKMGEYLGLQLHAKIGVIPIVVDIRGRGLFWGIEFGRQQENNKPFDPELNVSRRIAEVCMANGVVVYPGKGTIDGVIGDHIIIAPSFTITSEDIDHIVELVSKSLSEFMNEIL
ncbi:putative aminotransferase [Candida tropicalis]